jgi:hypothetical protein
MNEPIYIVSGIKAGPYVLDAEVSIEAETEILDVYTYNWVKDGLVIGAEHHDALCDFFFEEVVTTIAVSLETEGVI